MLEDPQSPSGTTGDESPAPAKKAATRTRKSTATKAAAKKTTKKAAAADAGATVAADAPAEAPGEAPDAAPAKKATAKKAAAKKTTAKTAKKAPAKKTTTKKAAAASGDAPAEPAAGTAPDPAAAGVPVPVFQAPETKTTVTRRTRGSSVTRAATTATAADTAAAEPAEGEQAPAKKTTARKSTAKKAASTPEPQDEAADAGAASGEGAGDDQGGDESGEGGSRRRRRRGGRRRRKAGEGGDDGAEGTDTGADDAEDDAEAKPAAKGGRGGSQAGGRSGTKSDKGGAGDKADQDDSDESGDGSSRRRRRRRRTGEDGDEGGGDQQRTSSRSRKSRTGDDQITAVSGSTRLEAKKQRRREGREAGRRRAPIVSEAEFLARREAVDRVMVIRQREDLTQIGVLEDKVLVEHYVARESQTSLIGNVYLGRVQNVLPSMEAAFIDIGKGRNAVLYAGEVNWSALGHKDGQPRKIESVLSSGQTVLVQVTKDPIGHKGARLTSQISLAGRFLVYVPDGNTSGISRKLPDTERNRLKTLLKEIVPDTAGVIVRTAAEGASEDELTRDVERLKARWEDIEKKAANKGAGAQLLYGEPDLTLKVVRDLFTEDFGKLVIQGDDAWDTVQGYVSHVAPDLEERLERFEPGQNGKDIFATYRVDEQIAKALDRKVWLPSGGSLVIDRTEAMTVVDVNTGKFTGSGGNLEETVTKNNLEAAEEVVRQLRLRDIGGIIVVDFIDMVLESNRDLVLRRLVECLGRDRTRHQVAEVTSLGLVQMTRKRIGTGLLESFSENCTHCQGRGVVIHDAPVEPKGADDDSRRSSGRRSRGGRGREGDSGGSGSGNGKPPTPKDVAAMAQAPKDEKAERGEQPEQVEKPEQGEQPEQVEKAEQPEKSEQAEQVEKAEEPGKAARPEKAEPAEQPAEEAPAAAEQGPAKGAEPEPVVEAPVAPAEPSGAPAEPPKVVTRTRRRSASRPAGPPTSTDATLPASGGTGAVGAPAATGLVEPGTASAEPGVAEAPQVEHVPIKKRGSRKR